MASASGDGLILQPQWLAHRYDENGDAIHFVLAERPLRRSVPFLIDEHLPGAATPLPVARAEAMRVAPRPVPVHFIFHSAYCCSTLLAAALDVPGVATSCKEPQILNDMVGWRHRGGPPDRVSLVLDNALGLLSRPFEPNEICIVKPSNIVNGLIEPMLKLRPQARCILLHAPLRAFVTSIARKGMWGRLWVRELLSRQLTEGMINLGFAPRDYLLHTDLQAAAVSWLAQQHLFAALASRLPDRVRTLNSEALVAEPDRALAAAAGLFGLALTDDQRAATVAEQFARNAKDGSRFDPGQREAARQAGEAVHGEEIDKVTAWAEEVAHRVGVPFDLPAPLLPETA
jgi:hypothetical protein